MIDFRFGISWPWPKNWKSESIDYIEIDKKFTKNKCFSMQLSKWPNFHNIFSIRFDTNWTGEDHGGVRLTIEAYRYFFDIAIYDWRHWNWETGAWYTDEEAKAEAEEWKDTK
jgi:hypothetical protein